MGVRLPNEHRREIPGPARGIALHVQQALPSGFLIGISGNISAHAPEGIILITPNRLDRGQVEPEDVAAKMNGRVQPWFGGAKWAAVVKEP